ncbi:MAG: hypothetical protein CMJ64_29155 [Planctomycetaceae bacterium]|nr:hypothetical protein [Planctomycetaceae bacterium]
MAAKVLSENTSDVLTILRSYSGLLVASVAIMNQQMDQSLEPTDLDHLEEEDVIVAELASKPTIFLDGSCRLRTVWRFLIFGVSFVVLQIAVGLVLGLILIFGLMASGDLQQFGDPQRLEQDLGRAIEEWTPVLTAIVAAPLTALTFGLVFVCRKYLDRRSIASMGFVRQRIGTSILIGCSAGLLPITTTAAILALTGGVRVEGVGL